MTFFEQRGFRLAVGAVVVNEAGLCLTGRRTWAPNLFKMPQGGIHAGETLEAALKRELLEEAGIHSFEILQRLPGTYRYNFPADTEIRKNKFLGQELTWFQVATTQTSFDPVSFIPPGEEPEFSELLWHTPQSVIELANDPTGENYVARQREQMYCEVFRAMGLLPFQASNPRAALRHSTKQL